MFRVTRRYHRNISREKVQHHLNSNFGRLEKKADLIWRRPTNVWLRRIGVKCNFPIQLSDIIRFVCRCIPIYLRISDPCIFLELIEINQGKQNWVWWQEKVLKKDDDPSGAMLRWKHDAVMGYAKSEIGWDERGEEERVMLCIFQLRPHALISKWFRGGERDWCAINDRQDTILYRQFGIFLFGRLFGFISDMLLSLFLDVERETFWKYFFAFEKRECGPGLDKWPYIWTTVGGPVEDWICSDLDPTVFWWLQQHAKQSHVLYCHFVNLNQLLQLSPNRFSSLCAWYGAMC